MKFVKLPAHGAAVEREEVKAMLHQTMEPFTASLIRVVAPGDLSCEGTALAKPVETDTLNWTFLPLVPGASAGGIVQTQSAISYGRGDSTVPASSTPILGDVNWQPFVLLMDPVVSYITRTLAPKDTWDMFTPLVPNIAYWATLMFPGVIANQASFPEYRCDVVGTSLGVCNIPIADMRWLLGPWKPYGDYVPGGDVLGTRVVWIDGADALDNSGAVIRAGQGWRFTMAVTIPAGYGGLLDGSWFVECRLHANESSYETVFVCPGPLVNSGSGRTFSSPLVAFSGYFSFWIKFDDTVGLTPIPLNIYSFVIELNTISAYRHASISGMQNKAAVIDQVRVNGSSMLLSNVVMQNAKGGTVYGIQSSAEHPWYYWTQSLTNITSANTTMRTVQNWDKGLYCFIKPQGGLPFSMDVAFQKQGRLNFSDTLDIIPMFRPFGPKSYIVAIVVPPDVGTSIAVVYPTAQTTFTICRSIEFTTMDQFFNVDVSKMSSSYFNDYADALRAVPQFYENPLHLAAIGSLVAGLARKVVEWAPRVAKGAAVVAGMLGQGQTVKASPAQQSRTRSTTPRGRKGTVVPARSRSRSGSRSSRGKAGQRKSSLVKVKLSKSQKKALKRRSRVT